MSVQIPEQLTFATFKEFFPITQENIHKELYLYFRERIKVQREDTAVKNLGTIFTATFKLSTRNGFRAMTLRDLSRETGISMGGLYNYISSKDDLALMIEEFTDGRIGSVILQMTEETGDDNEKLEIFIKSFIYIAELFQPWLFFMFMEAKNLTLENRQRAKAFEQRNINWLKDIISNIHLKKKVITQDTAITASVLMAALENWYLKRWYFNLNKTSPDDYANYCVNLMYKII